MQTVLGLSARRGDRPAQCPVPRSLLPGPACGRAREPRLLLADGSRDTLEPLVPERLNRVQVATRTAGTVTISWAARQELLERAHQWTEGAEIQRRFEAVGATRPVELHAPQKESVLRLIERWVSEVGPRNAPDGIVRLRDALLEDEAQGA